MIKNHLLKDGFLFYKPFKKSHESILRISAIYKLIGNGQIVKDYAEGKKQFHHKDIKES